MTLDQLWDLIEAARDGADDADDVAARVGAALECLSADELRAYMEHEARLLERSYTWALWGAAYVANGGCSDDGFDYFRGWLLAQGRAVFEAALADPDSIADLVSADQDSECEDMLYVSARAYETITGQLPNGPTIHLPALGPGWDFDDADEMRRRYPRLTARFG